MTPNHQRQRQRHLPPRGRVLHFAAVDTQSRSASQSSQHRLQARSGLTAALSRTRGEVSHTNRANRDSGAALDAPKTTGGLVPGGFFLDEYQRVLEIRWS